MSPLRASGPSKSPYAYRTAQRADAGVTVPGRAKLKKAGRTRTIEIVGKQGQAIHLPNEAGSPLASVYQSKDGRTEREVAGLPAIQSQAELGYRGPQQETSPGGQGYGLSLQDLQIVGSRKNAIPLVQRKQQAQAGKKNRQYFHETIPRQNQDIRSYTNLDGSRDGTAALGRGPGHTHTSMAVEPSDGTQAPSGRGYIYREIRDGPGLAGGYIPFPPQYPSSGAPWDYPGGEYLPGPAGQRPKVMTQPYMYSTAKEPAPARIAEIAHSDETGSSGRALAL